MRPSSPYGSEDKVYLGPTFKFECQGLLGQRRGLIKGWAPAVFVSNAYLIVRLYTLCAAFCEVYYLKVNHCVACLMAKWNSTVMATPVTFKRDQHIRHEQTDGRRLARPYVVLVAVGAIDYQ
jgi:hypothetical protein